MPCRSLEDHAYTRLQSVQPAKYVVLTACLIVKPSCEGTTVFRPPMLLGPLHCVLAHLAQSLGTPHRALFAQAFVAAAAGDAAAVGVPEATLLAFEPTGLKAGRLHWALNRQWHAWDCCSCMGHLFEMLGCLGPLDSWRNDHHACRVCSMTVHTPATSHM